MYEEEIGGDRHTDLLIRFAEACGTTGGAGEGPGQHVADDPRACRAGATRWRCARTRSSRWPAWWSGWNRRCRRSIAARRRRCGRNMVSPTRRWSSSTCISSRMKSTASAATRSFWSMPTRRSCSSGCLKICEIGAADAAALHQRALPRIRRGGGAAARTRSRGLKERGSPARCRTSFSTRTEPLQRGGAGRHQSRRARRHQAIPVPASARSAAAWANAARCACRVIMRGGEHLPEPNWKEHSRLGRGWSRATAGLPALAHAGHRTGAGQRGVSRARPVAKGQHDVRDPDQQGRPVPDQKQRRHAAVRGYDYLFHGQKKAHFVIAELLGGRENPRDRRDAARSSPTTFPPSCLPQIRDRSKRARQELAQLTTFGSMETALERRVIGRAPPLDR